MATVAQLIARRLHEAGVRHAFGIPGGEVLSLVDALREAGVHFVLVKHENGGGFMAEGVHHRTGAPALLVTTVGPGLVNAVNVVANAQQDRVPLIFLTGCIEPATAQTYTHQWLDQTALLGPITKARFVADAGAVDVMIDKAVGIALDDPPGPVHVDVPVAVGAAEVPDAPSVRRSRPLRGAPRGEALQLAREWLAAARRPLLIAGVEALNHDATEAVRAFVRGLNVPLITSYKAKGILPEDDSLALGGAGLSPVADKILLPLVRESDCVVLAGYDPIEMRIGWRDPWPAAARVVELTATPNTHYVHRAALSFLCDVGGGLQALGANLTGRSAWTPEEIATRRRGLRAAYRPDEEWGPAAIIDTARRALPRATIATVDSGAHRIMLSQLWEAYGARELLQSTGLCTMGCALPLAIGAKLAEPARPVVAFTGDGGLDMVMGELATARDLALPVIVVVFADTSLALIEMKQRALGLPNAAVDFRGTDYAQVARALGGNGHQCRSRAQLEDALAQGLRSDRFTVVSCEFLRSAYDGRI
ncbi:MAG: thiamine pyrophosphate-binding protein [Burkholderiales bacterium]|nr:thiamine pyrophosphate-binding protein [Burkholderiales bacterium]